jgi:hypothetical protein
VSVFECIVGCRKVFRQLACHRLSRTIGMAPAEKPLPFGQNAAYAGSATGKAGAIHAVRAQAAACGAWRKPQAARMLERKASISERSMSASRRNAPEALSTSPAADPASAEAVLTPTMLLETSLDPPAAC